MIRIVTKRQKRKAKSWYRNYLNEKHTDIVEVTTIWLLFFPVYTRVKVVGSQIQ